MYPWRATVTDTAGSNLSNCVCARTVCVSSHTCVTAWMHEENRSLLLKLEIVKRDMFSMDRLCHGISIKKLALAV